MIKIPKLETASDTGASQPIEKKIDTEYRFEICEGPEDDKFRHRIRYKFEICEGPEDYKFRYKFRYKFAIREGTEDYKFRNNFPIAFFALYFKRL